MSALSAIWFFSPAMRSSTSASRGPSPLPVGWDVELGEVGEAVGNFFVAQALVMQTKNILPTLLHSNIQLQYSSVVHSCMGEMFPRTPTKVRRISWKLWFKCKKPQANSFKLLRGLTHKPYPISSGVDCYLGKIDPHNVQP